MPGVRPDAAVRGVAEADTVEQRGDGAAALAFQASVERQGLAAREGGVERDVLGQVAQAAPGGELARGGIFAQHPNAPLIGRIRPSMSFMSVVLPAPL